ncbi:hypothetical protein ACFZC6_07245 [Streptomyces ossamyceticus]|uniref:Uncharacterized protein n=1 Tax=Streptomyces ossamyceticus TaxID=249581 RepID=A0ABV2V860_9ACTN
MRTGGTPRRSGAGSSRVGNDTLYGGAGKDTLSSAGGPGRNRLHQN